VRPTLGTGDRTGLEALCPHPVPDRPRAAPVLRFGGGTDGVERLDATVVGAGFSPHRHDTYAIGCTRAGVQSFRYRGELRHCLPGQWHVLHPDELHDGAPGTERGFGYRIMYVDPALVQEALGGAPLPFVADPVLDAGRVDPALAAFLRDIDTPLDDVGRTDLAVAIGDLLHRHGSPPRPRRSTPALPAVTRVRDLIRTDPTVRHPVAEFERVSGLDRWTVARQFRAAFGTSPSRFRTMRQLDRARGLMRAGRPLSEVATAVGFADQSHLTRMFKRTYGMTPAAWLTAQLRPGTSRPPGGGRGDGGEGGEEQGGTAIGPQR
jgi:AraC-like DNA-binding protein